MKSIRNAIGIEHEIAEKTLPVHSVRGESMRAALFLFAFSLIFGLGPTGVFLYLLLNGEFIPVTLGVSLLFFLTGLGVFVYALNMAKTRIEFRIGDGTVRFRSRTLFRRKEWERPLGEYRGVLLKRQETDDSLTDAVLLSHGDPAFDVELARYMIPWISEESVRSRWEGMARMVGLPALRDTTAGIEERRVEDIGRPLRETEPAGGASRKRGGDVSDDPPGLRRENRGAAEIWTVTARQTGFGGFLFVLIVPTALVYIGFGLDDAPGPGRIAIGIFGAVLGLYGWLFLLMDLFSRQRIELSPSGIRMFRSHPFGETRGRTVRGGDILEIVVDRGTADARECIQVLTAGKRYGTARGLSRESLLRLRDRMVERIRG